MNATRPDEVESHPRRQQLARQPRRVYGQSRTIAVGMKQLELDTHLGRPPIIQARVGLNRSCCWSGHCWPRLSRSGLEVSQLRCTEPRTEVVHRDGQRRTPSTAPGMRLPVGSASRNRARATRRRHPRSASCRACSNSSTQSRLVTTGPARLGGTGVADKRNSDARSSR